MLRWTDLLRKMAVEHTGLLIGYGLITIVVSVELILSPVVILQIAKFFQQQKYKKATLLFVAFSLAFLFANVLDGVISSCYHKSVTTHAERLVVDHLLHPELTMIDDNLRGTWTFNTIDFSTELGQLSDMVRNQYFKCAVFLVGSNIAMWDRKDQLLNVSWLVQLLCVTALPWSIFRRTYLEKGKTTLALENEKFDYLDDIFHNRRSVVAHGMHQETLKTLDTKTVRHARSLSSVKLLVFLEVMVPSLVVTVVTLVVFIARLKGKSPETTLKDLLNASHRLYFVGYILQAYLPMFFSYCSLTYLQSRLGSTESSRSSTGSTNLVDPTLGVCFHTVTFRYVNQDVLNGSCLQFPNNSTTALVGKSGSGKSTILNLIKGFLWPTEGYITYHNLPLHLIPDRHRLIGYVAQVPQLFNTTVWANIGYSVPELNREQVLERLRELDYFDFLARVGLTIDQEVGKNGERMSGGQKQMVQILRVLLMNPEVLLLDEPTAAMDYENSEAVVALIARSTQSRIVVMITHDVKLLSYVQTTIYLT